MKVSNDDKLVFKISKGIVDHPLWKRWTEKDQDGRSVPTLLSMDELFAFIQHNGIEEICLLHDVDGTSCRLTGSMFHIHKIAYSPYLALLLAVQDLQKEMYEYECNNRISS